MKNTVQKRELFVVALIRRYANIFSFITNSATMQGRKVHIPPTAFVLFSFLRAVVIILHKL